MTDMSPKKDETKKKLGFVDFLGWSFFGIGFLSGIANFVQAIVLWFIIPKETIRSMGQDPELTEILPEIWFAIFTRIDYFVLGSLALSILTAVLSWFFIKRREWARKGYLALLSVLILLILSMVFLQDRIFSELAGNAFNDKMEINMDAYFAFMRVLSAGMGLGFAAAFAWLVKKVLSPGVRAEFS